MTLSETRYYTDALYIPKLTFLFLLLSYAQEGYRKSRSVSLEATL